MIWRQVDRYRGERLLTKPPKSRKQNAPSHFLLEHIARVLAQKREERKKGITAINMPYCIFQSTGDASGFTRGKLHEMRWMPEHAKHLEKKVEISFVFKEPA
jgi:hypothetical protein